MAVNSKLTCKELSALGPMPKCSSITKTNSKMTGQRGKQKQK
jgi:hypothetical protein